MFNIFCISILFINYVNSQIIGVSLGSLYVLEPFITPHLFYPFLGNNEKIIGDTYSLCEYLGPYKTNKLLKKHWKDWINEDIIDTLYKSGINTIRIPVGDYMYYQYGPYAVIENGIKCFDGSLEHLDKIINYISKYNIKIIIDIHAWKDSQNGFDNSGETVLIKQELINNTLYYNHWSIRAANWIGTYNLETKIYDKINYENINLALNIIDIVLKKYKNYPNIWGLCPMNEPWEYTPEFLLKYFYKKVYDSFIQIWEHKKVLILHDSFRPYLWESCDFIDSDINNIKINIYLDTHQYKAWNEPVLFDILISSIVNWDYPKTCFKIIIGEFSLATDNCQMWLNGFMDNLPNYPLQPCYYEECPRLFEEHNKEYIKNTVNGPFGSGISYPLPEGYCPITTPLSLNKKISNDSNKTEKEYAIILFDELTKIFEKKTVGWIFWNFRTSSKSYSWNYLSLYNLGYTNLNSNKPTNKPNNEPSKNIMDYFYLLLLPIIVFILFTISYSYKLNEVNEYNPLKNGIKKTYGSNNNISEHYKPIDTLKI
jgi:glucan 1,3-beta-glucosidase